MYNVENLVQLQGNAARLRHCSDRAENLRASALALQDCVWSWFLFLEG